MGSPNAIAQSGNLFMFTMHNPVRWVDPTGLSAALPMGMFGIGAAINNILAGAWLAAGGATTGAAAAGGVPIFQNELCMGGNNPAAMAPNIIPRGTWGALDATHATWRRFNLTHTAFSQPRTRIVLHHTGTPTTAFDRDLGRETIAQRVRSIDNHHLETNRWAGVGYHFLIGYDGSIFEGRPINYEGNHARLGYSRDRNPFTIGIAMVGTFSNDNIPTQAALDSLDILINYVLIQIPTIDTIERHWGSYCYLGSWANQFMINP